MFASKDTLLTRPSGGYSIARSVRLRSSATAYFNRTMGTPTNSAKWTWSFWLKRGKLAGSDYPILYSAGIVAAEDFGYFRAGTEALWVVCNSVTILASTQVFRDTAAWYNMIFVFDGGNATASNRLRVYLNGVEITAWATDIRSTLTSSSSNVNKSGTVHRIATDAYMGAGDFYDGYLTEINFIDGQALTPSSFGSTNAITGVWQPAKYTGTYGTNGFYLNFSDNSNNTAATIGKDYSGNGNNWTPNNISVTAGVTYDSMVDSPTVSATSSNYAVMNPLNKTYSTYTLSDGNLNWTSSTINMGSHGTFQLPTSGKYYWEVVMTANAGGSPAIGIADGLDSLGNKGIEYRTSGNKEQNGGVSGNGSGAYGATWTTNDVIGVAYDADTSSGQITFYKNNSSQGVAYSSIQTNFPNGLFPSFQNNAAGTTTFQANFGQRPFSYTPPTGFVALNTQNLPTPTISNGAQYMAATTYAGSGANGRSVTTGFRPDFVWVKNRSSAQDNILGNSVILTSGEPTLLSSNLTNAEFASGYIGNTSQWTSTSFTVNADARTNASGSNYVAWTWLGGNTNGSGVSNTSGSITSSVSANPTAGFSVVTYTGTGANATVGHGLGVAPSMVIVKSRSAATSWNVYHISTGNTGAMFLEITNAFAADSTRWNNTSPTSTVFSLGNGGGVNASAATFVAYCFAAVAGYSAFGSYTGNGSTDGPFVYTGFRPRFILVKSSSGAFDWHITDTSRSPYNQTDTVLFPNSSAAETNGGGYYYDLLSNGFKCRNLGSATNGSGATYIFAAFAEVPFKSALGR